MISLKRRHKYLETKRFGSNLHDTLHRFLIIQVSSSGDGTGRESARLVECFVFGQIDFII